ncbi:hypothetical protein [Paraburkholderia sp. HD33-4]|uniref:hypothetical protein n=1 Tax=Paraburkholderia sp. HD33-4 TaxID=2883242 RepID=UPI001F2D7DE3|nr:hypothetical protein [Paraburkholderia sp. HD33-4]
MDNETIAARLRDLASNSPGRGKTARLRQLLPDVEAALAAGVPANEIRAALAEYGLHLTHRTFHGTLYRLRKQARSASMPQAQARTTVDPAGESALRPTPQNGTRPSVTGQIKSKEQLRAENPTLPMLQLSKLYAEQFGQPSINAEAIEELKRRFPQHLKA